MIIKFKIFIQKIKINRRPSCSLRHCQRVKYVHLVPFLELSYHCRCLIGRGYVALPRSHPDDYFNFFKTPIKAVHTYLLLQTMWICCPFQFRCFIANIWKIWILQNMASVSPYSLLVYFSMAKETFANDCCASAVYDPMITLSTGNVLIAPVYFKLLFDLSLLSKLPSVITLSSWRDKFL